MPSGGQTPHRIYLDDAGSAPVLPEVRAALLDVPAGNASSPHLEGREARASLDRARDVAAHSLGAKRTEITFVSSGTEAVNLALFGAARRLHKRGAIATWAAEHQAVLACVRRLQADGHEVHIAGVDHEGRADPDSIATGAILVSIGLANNEVGTVQPVAAVIERAHELGALVHVDACAGPRWIPIPAGADLVSISGPKLGAGRGGLLYVKDGTRVDPLLFGGPQEWGRRAGHEDVWAAVAVATALAVCKRQREARAKTAEVHSLALRQLLAEVGAELTGSNRRLPNFATCAFSGRRGEDMLLALDLAGIAASSGSACASGSLDPSHVLLAMGLSLDAALGSLRLTTGYATTDEEISRASATIPSVLKRTAAHA
ncbi:MAG TPA: aminotransferase class V-fold PLP-dependent enzyme [Candidatus Baltobacterales bacterium]|nr:aminotransferase class V-fold PLP-dependent enzyme [Candidatus Baltobacterales bacterium]